jgi:hypothetical protein
MNPIIPTHPHVPSFEQTKWLLLDNPKTFLYGTNHASEFILQHWNTFEKIEKYAQENNLRIVITRDWNYWDFTVSFPNPLGQFTSYAFLRVSHDKSIYIGDIREGNKSLRKATLEEVLTELIVPERSNELFYNQIQSPELSPRERLYKKWLEKQATDIWWLEQQIQHLWYNTSIFSDKNIAYLEECRKFALELYLISEHFHKILDNVSRINWEIVTITPRVTVIDWKLVPLGIYQVAVYSKTGHENIFNSNQLPGWRYTPSDEFWYDKQGHLISFHDVIKIVWVQDPVMAEQMRTLNQFDKVWENWVNWWELHLDVLETVVERLKSNKGNT